MREEEKIYEEVDRGLREERKDFEKGEGREKIGREGDGRRKRGVRKVEKEKEGGEKERKIR